MAILETCERVLNRHIGESTVAVRSLAALDGRSFAIEIAGLDVRVVIDVRDGRAKLRTNHSAAADATVKGTPLDLLGLLATPGSPGRLRATRAQVSGNVHVAEAFAELLRFARPDLEGELAGWVGDIAAHEIGTVSRTVLAFGLRTHRALELDLAEYLQQESETLPDALQAKTFYAEVERLRDGVERAALRLERLVRDARPAAGA